METNTNNNNTSSTESGSFLSRYGLWIIIAVLVGGMFLFGDKIKGIMSAAPATPAPSPGSSTTGSGTGNSTADASTKPTPTMPAGNDYVSGEAINKVVLGNYDHYQDNVPANQYNGFWGAVMSNFGDDQPKDASGKGNGISWNEAYVRAFLKGMDVAMRQDYVGIFKPFIQEYLNGPAKIPHWDVKVGQFRKSGVNR